MLSATPPSRLSLFLPLLFLLLLLSTPPTLASVSSSSPLDDHHDHHSAQDADVLANNYTYQPPALQQQQHAFAAPPVELASADPASASSQPTMCNKASSNPNRVVLPTNVTPSHYTLSITPDFKEFTFGGHVEIE